MDERCRDGLLDGENEDDEGEGALSYTQVFYFGRGKRFVTLIVSGEL